MHKVHPKSFTSRSPIPSGNRVRHISPNSHKSPSPTRSPTLSPVQRYTSSTLTKDYSSYVPVRQVKRPVSIERSQTTQLSMRVLTESNKALTRAGSKFKELQEKRMSLENESKKLEEKIKEIRKKVEIESKSIKKLNNKKPIPRPHCSLFAQKIKKIVMKKTKFFHAFGFEKIKKTYQFEINKERSARNQYNKKLLKVIANEWKKITEKTRRSIRNKMGIAERHYQLQLVITAYNKWQEYVEMRKLNPDDKSRIDEMGSLLQSFCHDALPLEHSFRLPESPLSLIPSPMRQDSLYSARAVSSPETHASKMGITPLSINFSDVLDASNHNNISYSNFSPLFGYTVSQDFNDVSKPRLKVAKETDKENLGIMAPKDLTGELLEIAKLHHERSLLYYYGMKPLHTFMDLRSKKRDSKKKAIEHYNGNLKLKGFYLILTYYVQSFESQEQ
ncbi:unnamed protein product [Blepharisma stoltei]|uniref:Uncharacterized protein n=1 Tax=Blepharisma stoltei TaxID=1481888 RepID=A0AAU9K5V0_9CILI|nr:unnamed protein product [Blepharisma stoltei]